MPSHQITAVVFDSFDLCPPLQNCPLKFLLHSPSQLQLKFEPLVVLQPTKITFRVTFPLWQSWTKLPVACVGCKAGSPCITGERAPGELCSPCSLQSCLHVGTASMGGPASLIQSIPYPAVEEESSTKLSPGHPRTNLLPGALDRD